MPSILNSVKLIFKRMLHHTVRRYATKEKIAEIGDIQTLYLSSNYLVINKPFDINVQGTQPVTVSTLLRLKYPHLVDPTAIHGFRFCHQIDYATSGVLLVALTKEAAKEFSAAQHVKSVEKYYLALLRGHVESERLLIDKPIGTDIRQDTSFKMCTGDKHYCRNAQWAVSKLLVLQRGLQCGLPATKVLMKLCTGRRHQLRLHCFDVGHPIIGDYTYCDDTDINRCRMFLHAYRLVFPSLSEPLDLCTEDPFTESEKQCQWSPVETVNEIRDEAFAKVSSIKS